MDSSCPPPPVICEKQQEEQASLVQKEEQQEGLGGGATVEAIFDPTSALAANETSASFCQPEKWRKPGHKNHAVAHVVSEPKTGV